MMKRKTMFALGAAVIASLIAAISLTGCSGDTDKDTSDAKDPSGSYQTLTAAAAKDLLDKEDDLYLVDVRTAEEYAEKHIPNAILIPNESIGSEPPVELPDKSATILIYCRSGSRSKEAAEKLIDMGYTNVYDFGGINDWPYDTATGAYVPVAADPKGDPMTSDGTETVLTGEFKEFTATSLSGDVITQDILSGYDVTVLNIWGTFCSPCLREMPDLGELASEYADKKLQIIGVVTDASQGDEASIKKAKKVVSETKADYLHLLPSEDLINIKLGEVNVVPTTIFIDSQGRIIDTVTGSKSKDKWESIFDDMLEQTAK